VEISVVKDFKEILNFNLSSNLHNLRNELHQQIDDLSKKRDFFDGFDNASAIKKMKKFVIENIDNISSLTQNSRDSLKEIVFNDLFGYGAFELFLNADFPIDAWVCSNDLIINFAEPYPYKLSGAWIIHQFPLPIINMNSLSSLMYRLAKTKNFRLSEMTPVFHSIWNKNNTLELVIPPASSFLRLRIRPTDIS
jgi:hypothetical protein